MGSPYCDLLRTSSDLRYAFSCDVRRSETSAIASKNAIDTKRIDGELRINATQEPVHIARIIYDTGASVSVVPIDYIASLLRLSDTDAWSHLAKTRPAVPLSSIVASALTQNTKTNSNNDGVVNGYSLPILLSFGRLKNKALLLDVVVVNTTAKYMLLSPSDAELAFVVLVDSGTAASNLQLPTRIRFFEHAFSKLKTLDSWRIAQKAGFAIPAPKQSTRSKRTKA